MKRTAKQLRQAAWQALTGRYWWMVLAGLIASVLGGVSYAGLQFNYGFNEKSMDQLQQFFSGYPQIAAGVIGLLAVAASFAAVVGIAQLLVGSAVELGYDLCNIKLLSNRDKPEIGDLFGHFSIFGRALWLRILMWLKIFAWALLLVVPGIVAAFRYAMAPYILAEHPEMTANEAIEESKKMMDGNKPRLFWLELSFIGWCLLAGLTLGIGSVFLLPYMQAANAAFYLELTGRLDPQAQGQSAQAEAQPEQIYPAEQL